MKMYLKKSWKQHMLVTCNKFIINIEELGAGTPIYFLHGFAGTTQSWKTVASIFAKKFKCYLIGAVGNRQLKENVVFGPKYCRGNKLMKSNVNI